MKETARGRGENYQHFIKKLYDLVKQIIRRNDSVDREIDFVANLKAAFRKDNK